MLAGVGAIVLLVALTVGVPIALITVVGLPLPHTAPKLSALTSQLDITAILRILSVIVWLAWIQLVWCVLVEIKAAASGTQGHAAASPKVPLAGATQSLAHRLVTAALLLFTAAAALTPAVISHGAAPARALGLRPGHARSANARQVTPADPGQQRPALTAAQAPQSHHHAPNSDKMYTVNPPVGRFHESLWEIAHNHLGDGRRYREIFELNSGRVQPDGSKLTIASLIRPGWVLLMPKDAHGPGIEAVTPKLAGELGLAGHPSQRGAGTGGPRAARRARPPVGPFGTMGSGPRRPRRLSRPRAGPTSCPPPRCWPRACWPRSAASGGSSCGGGRSAAGSPVPTRTRRWPRRPCGSARTTPRCGMLDTGLRHLCRQLAAAGRTPPTVFAAHLGQENLDLWVAPPDPNPPRPWQAADGGQVWRLPFAAMAGLDAPDTGGAPGDRPPSPRTPAWSRSVPTTPAGSWSTWRWPTA